MGNTNRRAQSQTMPSSTLDHIALHASAARKSPASRRAPAAVSVATLPGADAAPKKTSRRKPLTTEQIHERILSAITEHRLQPGTQLVEYRLAQIFDVSRTKIREATGRLVHDRIAVNSPNRGAFIASPTAQEARDVFAARRLIEPFLVQQVAAQATPAQITQLRGHLAREATARTPASAAHALLTLTGDFHLLLADMAGNSVLARTLRELESLTSLVIILYSTPTSQTCPEDEHDRLVDAIEARDGERAAHLMRHHLDHIEQALDLAPPPSRPLSLEDVFS